MSNLSTVTGEQLANALHALGLKFIMGGKNEADTLHNHPTRLIQALAESDEARLRMSLIPLFLEHPEFAEYVSLSVRRLSPPARLTLQCYYSAAVFLQIIYRSRWHPLLGKKLSLPDHFSRLLNLPCEKDPEANLRLLAERHQALSGENINWLGTYYHAAQWWINHLERTQR